MKQVDKTLSLFDVSNDNAIDIIIKNEELMRYYVDTKHLPKPFYGNIANVKAIVIGPDPSLDIKLNYKYVFGLEDPGSKYFKTHEFNLRMVGLGLDTIYVQNLVQNYCNRHVDKNPNWYEFAEIWKPTLKQEIDTLFSLRIPVFFTNLKVLQALSPHKINKRNMLEYYQEGKFIKPSENYLNRTMIPIMSSHFYHKWDLFVKNTKELLHKL
ncbi:MAG: hypothetical protein WCL51_00060 [Bacteroidota bacterium]